VKQRFQVYQHRVFARGDQILGVLVNSLKRIQQRQIRALSFVKALHCCWGVTLSLSHKG